MLQAADKGALERDVAGSLAKLFEMTDVVVNKPKDALALRLVEVRRCDMSVPGTRRASSRSPLQALIAGGARQCGRILKKFRSGAETGVVRQFASLFDLGLRVRK